MPTRAQTSRAWHSSGWRSHCMSEGPVPSQRVSRGRCEMTHAPKTIAVLVLALTASALAHAQTPPPPNPYRAVEGWARLPAGMDWGQVSGVELDAGGNLFVIHRSDPPILKFD